MNWPAGKPLDKVDKAFWEIVASIKNPGGISENDIAKASKPLIERSKTRIKTNPFWVGIMVDADNNGYSAERLLSYDERINAITPEKMMEIANKYYTRENVYTAILLPENESDCSLVPG